MHVPPRSTIACCEQYHRPTSTYPIHLNAFLCQMVDYYCNTISEYFPSSLFHMILDALILSILLLHKFTLRIAHGLTSGSLLLFKVALYIYRQDVIISFDLSFLSWYNLDAIFKVSNSSPLPLKIRGVSVRVSMDFGENLYVISAINGLHHFVAIPLHGSLYLQSWIYIIPFIAMGTLSLMLFTPDNIIPWLLIRS